MKQHFKYYAKTFLNSFGKLQKIRSFSLFVIAILMCSYLIQPPESSLMGILVHLSHFINVRPLFWLVIFGLFVLLILNIYYLTKKCVEQEAKLKSKLVIKKEEKTGSVLDNGKIVGKIYTVSVINEGATILKECSVRIIKYTLSPGKNICISIGNGDISGAFNLHPTARKNFEVMTIYNDGRIIFNDPFNKNMPHIFSNTWSKYREVIIEIAAYTEEGSPATTSFSYKHQHAS